MNIHSIKVSDLKFVPLTDDVKRALMEIEGSEVCIFAKQNLQTELPSIDTAIIQPNGPNGKKRDISECFDRMTHVALIMFPFMLPDLINPDFVETEDEFLDRWVKEQTKKIFAEGGDK